MPPVNTSKRQNVNTSPRLLVVVNVFAPDLGGGVLFADLCYGLAERGFEVTVKCAYPYYPEWRDKSGENGLAIRRTEERGVRVERHGLYIPRDPNSLPQRLVYEGSFFSSLVRRIPSRGSFDAMMVFCPLIGAVAYGAVCRRLSGIPFWLNVQDLAAEAAAAGGISSGAVADTALRVQDALFNQADVWSTISPAMVSRLDDRRRRDQPLLYIPNWLHESLADAIVRGPSRRERVPGTPIRLLYSGNIGTKQALLEFCRVLHDSDMDFSFRIQGDGSGGPRLRDWVRETGDERFAFHPLTDEDGLAAALHEADYCVITERGGVGGSFIPSKLIPALAAGTPVLAVCDADSPLGREMEAYQPGPRFSWSEIDELPRVLSEASDDQYGAWRVNAAQRAPFYNRDRVITLYENALRRLCAGGDPRF